MNANVYVNCRDSPSSGVDAMYKAIYNVWQSKPSMPLKSTLQWKPKRKRQKYYTNTETLTSSFLDMYVMESWNNITTINQIFDNLYEYVRIHI